MQFELFQGGENVKYYFALTANSGEVFLYSRGYSTKTACKKGLASVRENSRLDSRFELKKNRNGKVYFLLLAKNNYVLGNSPMYDTTSSLYHGIKRIKKEAVNAALIELENGRLKKNGQRGTIIPGRNGQAELHLGKSTKASERVKTIQSFAEYILANSKELDHEYAEIVDQNFWDLL